MRIAATIERLSPWLAPLIVATLMLVPTALCGVPLLIAIERCIVLWGVMAAGAVVLSATCKRAVRHETAQDLIAAARLSLQGRSAGATDHPSAALARRAVGD